MSTLLVEIGVEELPSGDVEPASRAFGTLLSQAVGALGLGGSAPAVFATPRRLAVRLRDLEPVRPRTTRTVRGPSRDRAYDADGAPSRALQGFLRGQGTSEKDIRFEDAPQGVYVVVDVVEGGEAAKDLLGPVIERTLASIPFARPMRWGEGAVRFGRPVVWLVALLDSDVVPCTFAGVEAGRESRGHRFLHPGPIPLGDPTDYESRLTDAFVLPDRESRKMRLRSSLEEAAGATGLVCDIPPALLEEVTDLVEWPTALIGRIDARFLTLPDQALTTPMVHHQRQFPTRHVASGDRAPAFVAVRNGDDRSLGAVRLGNERVLTARLTDALFFYERDQTRPLEAHRSELAGTELGAGLGTLLDRAERTKAIVATMLQSVPGAPWREAALRAAHLAFADRTTLMVAEFPELTGEMAAVYAALEGADAETVRAIREGHKPRDAEGEIPADPAGRVLALAIRAEEVVGAFAVGRIPTGSEDPYGVRRAALGILRIGLSHGIPGGLHALMDAAKESFGETLPADALSTARSRATTFLRERTESRLVDEGFAPEVAQAVCAADFDRLEGIEGRARALTEALSGNLSDTLITAYRRAARLLAQAAGEADEKRRAMGLSAWARAAEESPDAARLPASRSPAEGALEETLARVEDEAGSDLALRNPAAYFAAVSGLAEPLDRFFQEVLVMDPDPAVRSYRLGLLERVIRFASLGADLSRLGRQRSERQGASGP